MDGLQTYIDRCNNDSRPIYVQKHNGKACMILQLKLLSA